MIDILVASDRNEDPTEDESSFLWKKRQILDLDDITRLTQMGFSWGSHFRSAPGCLKGSAAQAMEIASLSREEFEAFYERA